MRGWPHAAVGGALGLVVAGPVGLLAGAVGAIIPDWDLAGTLVDRLTFRVPGMVLRGVLRLRHRGIWHWGGWAVPWGLVVGGLLGWRWGLGFGLGFLSHWVADAGNFSGVPLWFGQWWHWGRGHRSGVWWESMAAWAFALVVGVVSVMVAR